MNESDNTSQSDSRNDSWDYYPNANMTSGQYCAMYWKRNANGTYSSESVGNWGCASVHS